MLRAFLINWGILAAAFAVTAAVLSGVEVNGGFGSYLQFWDSVTRAVPHDIDADPRALTIGYTVDYTRRDGSTSVDSTRLRLVFRDGDYLIDSEG